MIQSIGNNAFEAYQSSINRHSAAAQRIAGSGSPQPQDIVDLKASSLEAKTSLALIKAENGTIGSLLDLLA